jgi:flagellar biosynthesis protein FlhG
MSDQADQLRRLVRATVLQDSTLQPGPPLVVVSGSQKGVGTTTIAIQLVKELAKQGKRTVLVDANPTHPEIAKKWSALEKLSVESLRRANSAPHGPLAEVLAGDRTVTEALEPVAAGVRILPGCWTPEAPPELGDLAIDRLLDGLCRLQDSTDVVVADLGYGMSPWGHRFWLSAQQILLVTTSKPAAVMDSYATLKLAAADSLHERVRIVVNRCWEKQQARAVFTRLDHTCQRFLDFSLSHASTIAECVDVNCHQTHADRPETVPAGGFVKACHQAGDFQPSVRLLAAEVISNYLVTIHRRLHPTAAHGAMV